MTVLEQPPAAYAGLVARVKAILLSPRAEWVKIEAEPATMGGIYTGYVLPLAAIGPVCGLIGGLVFGYGIAGFHYRPSIGGALTQAILHYGMSLIGVFVMALIIDALAPSFGGRRGGVQALKVAAYSSTAGWLVGIFALIPSLSVLGLLGIYSLFLLFLGLPRLMQAPETKAIGYTVVVILVAAVLYVIIGVIGYKLIGFGAMGEMHADAVPAGASTSTAAGTASGTLSLPNGGQLDMGKLQAAVGQLGAVAKQLDASGQPGAAGQAGAAPVTAVSSDALKALLPASLPGGFARTETQTGTAFGGADAEATYQNGSKTLKLSVTDLASAGSLATLAGAFGIESNKETATGFDKVGKVDGRLTVQQFDTASHAGKYSVMLADRFLIDAEGTVGSFDDLKNAVAAIGPDRVLALK